MQRDARIPSDMNGIFEYCWSNQLINCNIQIQNEQEELHMYTYFPFNSNQPCGHTKAQHINQFLQQNWLKKPNFHAKLNNFYKCPLIAVVRHIPPYFMVYNNSFNHDGKKAAHGFEMDLINELAFRLNFTLIFKVSALNNGTGIIVGAPFQMVSSLLFFILPILPSSGQSYLIVRN